MSEFLFPTAALFFFEIFFLWGENYDESYVLKFEKRRSLYTNFDRERGIKLFVDRSPSGFWALALSRVAPPFLGSEGKLEGAVLVFWWLLMFFFFFVVVVVVAGGGGGSVNAWLLQEHGPGDTLSRSKSAKATVTYNLSIFVSRTAERGDDFG